MLARLEERLEELEEVEELFELFDLPFEPRVLATYRLQILRRFGVAVQAIDIEVPTPEEPERWRRYSSALADAHHFYAAGAPSGQHIFKGLSRAGGLIGSLKKG